MHRTRVRTGTDRIACFDPAGLATPAAKWYLGGAVIAFALGVPLVSRIVRIMLYQASLWVWPFVVPSQGGPMAGSFLVLAAVVFGRYGLLRLTLRFACVRRKMPP